jgi:hypothetical protein
LSLLCMMKKKNKGKNVQVGATSQKIWQVG